MKIAILFILTFSFQVFGKSTITAKDFASMNTDQKVKVIEAYKEFLSEYSKTTTLGDFASHHFSIFSEAFASGNFDCFYAGWPSRTVPQGGKRLCTTPVRGNPDYNRLASGCGANSLLCQPALFGSGLCVSIATKSLRNSAFAQCETKFREAGRTVADIVRGISSSEERTELDDLIRVGQDICDRGLQARTNMCRRLVEKLIAVKNELPAQSETRSPEQPQTPAQTTHRPPQGSPEQAAPEQTAPEQTPDQTAPEARSLEVAAQTAVEVTSGGIGPEQIDCDPNTPGIQTEPPVRRAEVSVPSQVQTIIPNSMDRVFCARPEIQGPGRPMSEMQSYLAQNNIRIVHGTPDQKHVERFIEDFSKFPQVLREEMHRRGSRIHLIVGEGVSQDPSWSAEAARGHGDGWEQTTDGRSWARVSGSGGYLGNPSTPTRIVINQTYSGRQSNIFLHEYAHTMDRMYGEYSITRSRIWQRTLASDTNKDAFLQRLCPNNYCNNPQHPEESFAELFAYYHSCPESRAHLQRYMPNVSRLFERMTTVRALLDGRINLADR